MVWAATVVLLATTATPVAAPPSPTPEEAAWLNLHAEQGFSEFDGAIWVYASGAGDGSEYFMRLTDLMLARDNRVEVWVRSDHSKAKAIPYRLSKFRITFLCSTNKFERGTSVSYMADGRIYSYRPARSLPPSQDIIPGTMAEAWHKMACWRYNP